MTVYCRKNGKVRRDQWFKLADRAEYKATKLAEICCISLRQLERYFDEDFGCNPYQWLHEQRMTAARQLLPDAETIKEAAYQLHFKQPSHFCHAFKKYHGLTPTEFCVSGSAVQSEFD